jgi:hypothetical protein
MRILLTRLESPDRLAYRVDVVGPEPEWRLYLSRTGQVPR